MIVVNFFHPLTSQQRSTIEELCASPIDRVVTATSQIDVSAGLAEQIHDMLDALPLTADEWQTEPLLFVLPALNYSTAVMLADIHGRMGHFPAIVRISPLSGTVPTSYGVSEVIDLQQVRDAGRSGRFR